MCALNTTLTSSLQSALNTALQHLPFHWYILYQLIGFPLVILLTLTWIHTWQYMLMSDTEHTVYVHSFYGVGSAKTSCCTLAYFKLHFIIQYCSNCILRTIKVWGFQLKNITKKPATRISVTTVWQDWLGMDNPKNFFRLTINLCIKLLKFLITEFPINW